MTIKLSRRKVLSLFYRRNGRDTRISAKKPNMSVMLKKADPIVMYNPLHI
jgi:hypothetical protein